MNVRSCAPLVASIWLTVFLAGVGVAAGSGKCSFVSVSGPAFGTYDVFAPAPLDSTGTIGFQCNPGTGNGNVEVSLSAGSSGSFVSRAMRSGSDTLSYNLFLDPAKTQIWGDGTGGSSTFTASLAGGGWTSVAATIYGRVPPGQNVAAGTYLDTITVTMNW